MDPGSATSGSRAWYATFDFPPSHPDDDVRRWLATELLPTRETWVAAEPDGRVVALMALSDDMIDQLYVAPDWIGTGIGQPADRHRQGAPPGRPRPVLLPGQHPGAHVLRARTGSSPVATATDPATRSVSRTSATRGGPDTAA